MNGRICNANPEHGRYAAEIDDGNYIAFELLDSIDLTIGDGIAGPLLGHGGETFTLLESGEQFSVFVEMIGATRVAASTWTAR